MLIEIKNCNNIEVGNVEIKEKVLNIKYAINGTGKSTLARALVTTANDRKNNGKTLAELTPFKLIGSKIDKPHLAGSEQVSTVKIFDEKFINDFVFQADELLKGSFNVFICDENYVKGMEEIDALVAEMKTSLAGDADIKELLQDFGSIVSSFGNRADGGIHGSSILAKGFKEGNKVTNIPMELSAYKNFIQHTDNFKWIKWQLDGKSFMEISHDCPYCTTDIQTKKETIRKVSEVYDATSVEKLSKVVETFTRLSKYFSDEARFNIDKFISNIDGYTDEQEAYLREIKSQIDILHKKFLAAQNLGFSSFKEVDKIIDRLTDHKIELDLFDRLRSENTISKVKIVNSAIDDLITKAGKLKGSIARQNSMIQKLIKEHSGAINGFLKNAGYKYVVSLEADKAGEIKLKLKHADIQNEVSNAKSHMSFGERNAFALVLFMYDALKENPDLIILDDPISSFDKNKKYAIIEMLFKKGNSFSGKTVLLLTHDFDPLVDIILHHPDRFCPPYAAFLENNNGVLSEKEIKRNDIKTFIEISKANIATPLNELNRLVYLRRYFEIENKKGFAWDVVSSLFHKRDVPQLKEVDLADEEIKKFRDMTAEEIETGSKEICTWIDTFEYQKLIQLVQNKIEMKKLYASCTNNYEKLHFYRIIFEADDDNIKSTIIRKFINEAFHIENNYIYQLNPAEYQLVPQYVIDECDSYLETI